MLRIPPLPMSFFFDDYASMPVGPKHSDHCLTQKKVYKFQEQHADIYAASNVNHPPEITAFPQGFQDAALELTQRAIEVVIYAEETEPWTSERMVPQFLDCNMSLKFASSNGNRAMFSFEVPTLATTTILWMRVRLEDGTKLWRLVKGKYLLRLVGYGDPKTGVSDKDVQLLAGNAFSGFAVGAVLLAIFANVGNQPSLLK